LTLLSQVAISSGFSIPGILVQGEVRVLEPRAAIEREISGGEAHSYRITLASHQFLLVVVNQHGVDVVVRVFGPDAQQIADVNNTSGAQGTERLSVVADVAGDYRLEVRPARREAARGRYDVKVEQLRAATQQDKSLVAAERASAEGRRLYALRTGETLRGAVKKYEEAVEFYRAAGDRPGEANSLNSIGETYNLLGESRKAIASFAEALLLSQSLGDRLAEARSINNLGQAYRISGEPLRSLEYFNTYLSIMQEIGDRREQAAALSNIGASHVDMNEPQKALRYISQALPIYRELGVRQGEAISLTNLGAIYSDLGEYEKALDHFFQVLPLLGGYQYGKAAVLINIGRVYNDKGEPREALKQYSQAASLAKATGARRLEVEALDAIGAAYTGLGEAEKALESLRSGLSTSRELGLSRQEAVISHHIGEVYASIGDSEKALQHYRHALALSRNSRHRILEAATLYGIARAESVAGNLVEARNNVQAALVVAESVRISTASRELRASFLASAQDYYEFFIHLLMRLHDKEPAAGYDGAALEVSERGRARSLLEMLAEARVDIRQGVNPQLLERERNLSLRINAKAERHAQLLNNKSAEEQAASKELDSLLTELQDVQAQIRDNSPRYAALTQPQPLSLKEIQRVLDADTLLLEYSLGKEHSYLWAVSATAITSFKLPGQEEVEAAARRVYDLLTARAKRVTGEPPEQRLARLAQADSEYPASAARLSQILLAPVATQLEKKRLLIVGDGALHYIPFASLPVPLAQGSGVDEPGRAVLDRAPTPSSRPLIADHEIVSLPSASALAVLRRELAGRKPASKLVAVLADPVFDSADPRIALNRIEQKKSANQPILAAAKEAMVAPEVERSAKESGLASLSRLRFSRQEADAIAALVPGEKSLKATDFAANRAMAISEELGQYRIVHFATHVLLNSQRPELSGIVLSLVDKEGRPQDGFLRLHETYNLKLEADLVVLSACQTALGKEIKGEGLAGLTRGFMYAGAPRIVATLWSVEDRATAELMKRFYREMLGKGVRPAAALRAAQVAMWKQKGWEDPFYWGGFVLQGEWQ
jgi:CHAT domain-containing protein